MAGIGLELKKIYSKNNLSNIAMGAVYSSMVTVGPTLLIVLVLVLMYAFLGFNYINIADRELLSSTILYTFIFSGILISPFNALFSRYIADKIYMRKFYDILPSYYVGLSIVCFFGTLAAIPIMHRLYFVAGIWASYIFAAYILWMSIIIVFFSTIYIHATKDYKIIFLFYIIGMSIGFLAGFLFKTYVDTVNAIIYGLAIGFFIVAFLQMAIIRQEFKSDSKNFSECLKYFWICRKLFIANALYTLGIYIHIFIFWTTEGRIIIAQTFINHPAYDMATCLAMFSNISTSIIFIVMAETQFHEEYQHYMESVIGGTYRLIQKNKNIMFRTLAQQIVRLFTIQSMITAIFFLIVVTFLPKLFFSSIIIEIYPVLSVGYLIMFLMYCIIIYLYYFNDQSGCTILSGIFFLATGIGTYFSKDFEIAFYGMGLVIGSLCAFTYGFFRIRYIEKNINRHIFCNGIKVKPTQRTFNTRQDYVVYRRPKGMKS